MKILLFGANGMLGQAIKKTFEQHTEYQVISVARTSADYTMDICDDQSVSECFNAVHPDVVINAIAIVDLNICESEKALAYFVNTRFVMLLAELSAKYRSYLIQVSTDHFFSGDRDKKHSETSAVCLLNEYARTKYLGESSALVYKKALVLRTNIVGFRGHCNKPTFLEWVIRTILNDEPLVLFHDFYTSSIHVRQFANILLDLLIKRPIGLYNLASQDVVSKQEFIVQFAQIVLGTVPRYEVGSVKGLAGCMRAESLGLNTRKIEGVLGYEMPDLLSVLNSIKHEYEGGIDYGI